jgi:hypothetical protein
MYSSSNTSVKVAILSIMKNLAHHIHHHHHPFVVVFSCHCQGVRSLVDLFQPQLSTGLCQCHPLFLNASGF